MKPRYTHASAAPGSPDIALHKPDLSVVRTPFEVHLDDRVYGLVEQVDKLEQARMTEQAEWRRRLADQRDELRAEMLAVTRQGWELIVGGLVWSAVGTALGMVA